MIVLNREHDEFDLDMEVLCSLSQTPISMTLFASDCGMVNSGDVVRAVKRLQKSGVPVQITNDKHNGRCMSLSEPMSPTLLDRCESYMLLVYANAQAVAAA